MASSENDYEWLNYQYKEQVENTRLYFSQYLQWYYFFWTLNVTVLAISFTDLVGKAIFPNPIIYLFITLNIVAICVSYIAWKEILSARNLAIKIGNSIGPYRGSPFSIHLIHLACGAGAFSILGNLVCWVFLLFRV